MTSSGSADAEPRMQIRPTSGRKLCRGSTRLLVMPKAKADLAPMHL